jgi:hypothetical protein
MYVTYERSMTYASTISRTRHAERFFEAFLALPLVSEFVFRSPQIVDTTQKEVADLLVSQTGASILLSLKCQGDPARRDAIKTTSWANKQARKALNQLRGALRTQKGKALVRSRAPGASRIPRWVAEDRSWYRDCRGILPRTAAVRLDATSQPAASGLSANDAVERDPWASGRARHYRCKRPQWHGRAAQDHR